MAQCGKDLALPQLWHRSQLPYAVDAAPPPQKKRDFCQIFLPIYNLFCLFIFYLLFRAAPWHMEVPRLGV